MPKAKYEEIYRNLKQKIEGNVYTYGSLLPSENDFIEIYSCSRNTIRRALTELAEIGYVHPIHGKGVRIIYQPAQRTVFTVGGIETFKETAARNNLHVVTKVIHFSVEAVTEELSEKTGFDIGELIYHIIRVRNLDGKDLILDINMFRADLVPRLTAEIASDSVYEYIENTLNMQISTSKRQVTVERSTKQDEVYLDLGDYDCLAVITGQTYNADGIMFEYTQSRHHPDYFCFMDTAVRKKTGNL